MGEQQQQRRVRRARGLLAGEGCTVPFGVRVTVATSGRMSAVRGALMRLGLERVSTWESVAIAWCEGVEGEVRAECERRGLDYDEVMGGVGGGEVGKADDVGAGDYSFGVGPHVGDC